MNPGIIHLCDGDYKGAARTVAEAPTAGLVCIGRALEEMAGRG